VYSNQTQLIYVICVCLLYTYCVFVLFFFVLCTLCWQFLWEGSYLRYLCLVTVHILCFCFVFLRLVYPMLAVSLGGLFFTLFVFVYYTRIVFLFCFPSSCVPYVGSFSGRKSPSRETANIGCTRRRKTKQKHNTCIVNKQK
jgi:hypothetical protein